MIYVGSTIQTLCKRMATHRIAMNATEKKNRLIYQAMNKFGVTNFYIELIENYPCDDVEQLRKKEGYFIREIGTLNSLISGRNKKEWTIENAEHVKLNAARYHDQNKEKHNQQSKKWREEHIEEMKQNKHAWYEQNKIEISIKSKENYLTNKVFILEKNKQYTLNHKEKLKEAYDKWNVENVCECGGKFRMCHKLEHEKTKIHIYFNENNICMPIKGNKIICPCGGCYTSNKDRHEKSKNILII